MTFAAVVGPLVAFAAGFQTLVILALPVRLRSLWAPMTIATAGASLAIAAGFVFGFPAIGLGTPDPVDLMVWAGSSVLLSVVVGSTMLRSDLWCDRLADPRVISWSRREAATHILFRIPVLTALIEEAFFRGVLHAALMAVYPPNVAVGLGAALFGIWHIGPAVDQARATGAEDTSRSLLVAITVVATTVAGVGLVWLRIETGSIWAPFAVHAGLNMTMAVFARAAGNRQP